MKYARRLQKIGSSMLISLPSDWVRTNRLNKGNTVFIETNEDNSISLFPSEASDSQIKDVTILYSESSVDSLINQIYGAYLLGYNDIRIKGKRQILFEHREHIKLTMRKLVGLEIVDEDNSNIAIQFLLDANTLDAEKILRRMNSIVGGMYRDALDGLRLKSEGIKNLIFSRDDEVDRQYFLLVRLIRSAMVDQKLARKLNLSNIDILDYRIAANHLESAGDYIGEFASTVPSISRTKIVDEISEAGSYIEKMQEKSVAAFTKKNRSESIGMIKMYNEFRLIMDSITELLAKIELTNSESTIAVLNSIHSMDKIAKCWVDVADLVKPVYLLEHKQDNSISL
ncbi:MAG TPA: phosphate uptake regulator PhoU [Candidatus Nitrosopolaris rasttigaisensis]|nr:phosphate uptake regulator PhoU [Candidatus Nitrosopolaris rasttigaisensis]